jgi:hypothetical protein
VLFDSWCQCLLGIRIGDVALVETGAASLEDLIASVTVQHAFALARWFRGYAEIQRGRASAGIEMVLEGERMYVGAGTTPRRSSTAPGISCA